MHNYSARFTHPVHKRMVEYWRFLRASYIGGREWYDQGATGDKIGGFMHWTEAGTGSSRVHKEQEFGVREVSYLWRHPREKDPFYKLRHRSSVYWNFVKPNVDAIAGAVAKRAIADLPPAISYIHTDSDRRGTDLADFRRSMISWMLVYGHVNILADKPIALEEPESLAEESEMGLLPYMRILSPLDVVDWQWNEPAGIYDWVLIVDRTPFEHEPTIEKKGSDANEAERIEYRLWTPTGWTQYSHKGETIGDGPGYGFVPVTPVFRARDPLQPEPIGISAIEDIAELARLSYNKFSWLTDEQRQHCFNQVFLKRPDKVTKEEAIRLGSSVYVGGAEDFRFIAPDVNPMNHLEESMLHDLARARHMFGIETKSEASQAAKSAEALQLEREQVDAMLANVAVAAEGGERAGIRMVAEIAGADATKVVVKYKKDFTDLSAASRVDSMLVSIEKGGFEGKAKAELQKEILRGLLPDLDDDTRKAIEGDIDAQAEELEAEPEEVAEVGAGPFAAKGEEDGAPEDAQPAPVPDEEPTEGEDGGNPFA